MDKRTRFAPASSRVAELCARLRGRRQASNKEWRPARRPTRSCEIARRFFAAASTTSSRRVRIQTPSRSARSPTSSSTRNRCQRRRNSRRASTTGGPLIPETAMIKLRRRAGVGRGRLSFAEGTRQSRGKMDLRVRRQFMETRNSRRSSRGGEDEIRSAALLTASISCGPYSPAVPLQSLRRQRAIDEIGGEEEEEGHGVGAGPAGLEAARVASLRARGVIWTRKDSAARRAMPCSSRRGERSLTEYIPGSTAC